MLTQIWRRGVLACLILTATAKIVTAATWEVEIKPGPTDNFTHAGFRLWLEDGGSAPKALLILAPGWNVDGRSQITDPRWQAWAKKQQVALLGISLQSTDEYQRYDVVENGSGDALFKALRQLASASHVPRIADLPLLVFGHSAGGQFGYGLACWEPERVVAFVAVKGGVYESRFNLKVRTIPALFIIGENDDRLRLIYIIKLFEENRQADAPWCVAFEPHSGHEIGRSRDLAEPFLAGALSIRLGEGLAIKSVAPRDGWLGVRSSLEIERASAYATPDFIRTVWLPDEATAKQWRRFCGEE